MRNDIPLIAFKVLQYAEHGCSDGSCCLVKNTGQVTNGGCVCLPATGKIEVYKRIAAIELSKLATREIPHLIEEILELRGRLEELDDRPDC